MYFVWTVVERRPCSILYYRLIVLDQNAQLFLQYFSKYFLGLSCMRKLIFNSINILSYNRVTDFIFRLFIFLIYWYSEKKPCDFYFHENMIKYFISSLPLQSKYKIYANIPIQPIRTPSLLFIICHKWICNFFSSFFWWNQRYLCPSDNH